MAVEYILHIVLQIAPAAKKLWDKGPGAGGDSKGTAHLPPLQLNPEQMWRDPTWSAQGWCNFIVYIFIFVYRLCCGCNYAKMSSEKLRR